MTLDLIGVGIGPFNLSLAAMAKDSGLIRSAFFDANSEFGWHPGMLLPTATMQTYVLQDLVTTVSPRSEFSFINYLVERKKIYRFLATEQLIISRDEFSDYLRWACDKMPNLHFSHPVEQIDFNDSEGCFEVQTSQGKFQSQHICLGTGHAPWVPKAAQSALGKNCFHAAEIALLEPDFTGKRVIIVGGGQSGADVMLNTLDGHWGEPANLSWLSRRPNFQPLDESIFTNEYFTPEYVNYFYTLPEEVRQQEIRTQKLPSDGISYHTLEKIYQHLYHKFDVLQQPRNVSLLPHRALKSVIRRAEDRFELKAEHGLSQCDEHFEADIVILATGYRPGLPEYLKPLLERIPYDGEQHLPLEANFNLRWNGPDTHRIYAVNAGIHSHGSAEGQLTLTAWRSAKIINHLLGKAHYDISPSQSLVQWWPGK
ncbi:lysine N(6)-hydroxylase/L-ornithine N(5)-oxygenase family protein [Rouxiella badensis]|jgi:lysine N6-hydroxylase|uniref:Lysine 6-monooxygenase n=1 Tax=Rouxiella badensis TaxID=1646377 RepID=A0A1X0WCU7_9GAMM|nr:SidA/IucD/PvdA family monooxygenase [Rouxiella badensis]MCC3702053.1 SidA/IucD/PvdA family monooxygenase [Rouxiella badensis]MCC3717047.1 SidA/IucD/PvdA family monooxygenase [Rouxiella badensis]MCC3728155.1 SidA/IucD/PvdA family monooxygenase [Rouxiella badensis]MCC3732059.1 SidA/IucD/PvdA family monooxygenase [Rouxiella badensis]MCC3739899.1 SidA/IucD/PvdA family monooxygenase [Rouxiella badensis]